MDHRNISLAVCGQTWCGIIMFHASEKFIICQRQTQVQIHTFEVSVWMRWHGQVVIWRCKLQRTFSNINIKLDTNTKTKTKNETMTKTSIFGGVAWWYCAGASVTAHCLTSAPPTGSCSCSRRRNANKWKYKYKDKSKCKYKYMSSSPARFMLIPTEEIRKKMAQTWMESGWGN